MTPYYKRENLKFEFDPDFSMKTNHGSFLKVTKYGLYLGLCNPDSEGELASTENTRHKAMKRLYPII